MKDSVVIIPVSSPGDKLNGYIASIIECGYKVILVFDGCEPDNIFHVNESCIILRNAVSQGVGRAVKTGVNYILTRLPECKCAVIADDTCTYSTEDIALCEDSALSDPAAIVLGSRKLTKTSVPFKARFINNSFRIMFRTLCGINIKDSRTSLRAFSRNLMADIMGVQGEGSDFMVNMLLYTKQRNIPITEAAVDAQYFPAPKKPLMNNLADLLNIFFVFIKFMVTSLSSFVIDLLAFTLFVNIFKGFIASPQYYILYSTILSRVISAFVNFSLNKYTVFKNKGRTLKTFIKYASLCAVQLLVSSTLVFVVYDKIFAGAVSESIIKIFVDAILFFVSFQVQREWVFK